MDDAQGHFWHDMKMEQYEGKNMSRGMVEDCFSLHMVGNMEGEECKMFWGQEPLLYVLCKEKFVDDAESLIDLFASL